MYGPELIDFIKKVGSFTKKYPELNSGVEFYEMSRKEQMEEWWRRYRLVMESEEMHPLITQYSSSSMQQSYGWTFCFPGTSPISLHQMMFTDCLNTLTSEEQKAHYLPQADHLNIIGCYA